METEIMIPVVDFCIHHNIELSFIHSLRESGLIDIIIVKEAMFVSGSQLKHLEILMRLKEDMDINIEGIETITYLLQRITAMQQQIIQLNNKLSFYKSG